jgi:hypothetical protein
MSEPPLVPEYDPASAPSPGLHAASQDGLRACVGADGIPIFTDRRCEDLGATEQQARAAPPGAMLSPGLLRVHSCARNQDDLLAGVRAALESHDANRLADFYHWTGMGTAEGYRLMARLDAFSARPVVDVQLVRGARADPDPEADYFQFQPPVPPATPDPPADAEPGADPSAEAPAPPRRPHARLLRVDQMRSDRDVAATITYFHLLTNAGCWWMRF